MPFIHSNRWDHPCRTSDHIDLSLSQKNNTIDRESLGEDLAWVEETLLLGDDGRGEMAVVDSQVVDENREGLREAWGIGTREEIDGTLEDIDVHHWDEFLETSLFGMEQYLDSYNGTFVNEDTEIHEELGPPFLSSLIEPEDINSEMTFRQERYGGVVHDEKFTSLTYVNADMSSNTPGMTTCISSFSGTPEIDKSSPSAFHATPQTLPPVTSVSRKRVRKQRARNARPIRSQNFPCDIVGCTSSYTRIHELQRHLKAHSGIKPHICQIADCNRTGAGFARKDHLRQHLRQVHGVIS